MATPAKDFTPPVGPWLTLGQAMARVDRCYEKFMEDFYEHVNKYQGGRGALYLDKELDKRQSELIEIRNTR